MSILVQPSNDCQDKLACKKVEAGTGKISGLGQTDWGCFLMHQSVKLSVSQAHQRDKRMYFFAARDYGFVIHGFVAFSFTHYVGVRLIMAYFISLLYPYFHIFIFVSFSYHLPFAFHA